MSENAVTAVIAFLFGGMIFLLAYTRIGGLAAALLALAILAVYLAVEAWQAWRQGRASRIERAAVYRRWDQW